LTDIILSIAIEDFKGCAKLIIFNRKFKKFYKKPLFIMGCNTVIYILFLKKIKTISHQSPAGAF